MKQKGFSLIELVVVIAITGILAATAIPKFLNITTNAKESVLLQVKKAVVTVDAMVYGQALLQGVEKEESGSLEVDGTTYPLTYGHLDLEKDTFMHFFETDLNINNLTFDDNNEPLGDIVIYGGEKRYAYDLIPDCRLEVRQDSETGVYKYDMVDNDC
ncbi:pilin [Vibrio atypicus]|uniref:pilin n=1 Tax=Vibrio atypicus TaxID=558271 RepID=UPI0013576973|nr:type II secretion system protein [Vibrio atypicus]